MLKDLLEKIKDINENDPFLLTFTFPNKAKDEKEMESFLFQNKFPADELENTKQDIIRLIDAQKNRQV